MTTDAPWLVEAPGAAMIGPEIRPRTRIAVRTVVRGKNIEVPDRVRRYAERKLDRVERLLDDRSDALLELSIEQHRSAADSHIAEVTLVIDGQTLRSHATGPTHKAAIDTVTDKAERRAVDHKEKPLGTRGPEGRQLLERLGEGTSEPPTERRIVKTKRFDIEPMFEEDAIAEMEDLGHSFFIFVNAEDERLNVLYRRRDGHYGVIEPVSGGEYTPGRDGRRGDRRP
jgi:putative sigma-54 modulation protein